MASNSIFNYNPDEVNCLAWGIPLTGFADGSFISVTKDLTLYSSTRTPDGTVARVGNNDKTYTINLTFHCGSFSNDVLTKFWQLDEITRKGKFPLLIKDSSGTDLFFSTNTWIESTPEMLKSTSVDNRTWVLRSSQAVVNFGSNMDPSSILQDLANIAISAIPALEGIV